jgi:ornithine--oxo-acid transaminase
MHVAIVKRRGAEASWKDTHEHTIRIAPPLVITSDQVDWALDEIGATSKHDFS